MSPAFRALVPAFVPETARATPEQWSALEATVDGALGRRPPGLQRQVAAFLRLLNLWARVRYRAPLTRLGPDDRQALVESFARSPLLLFRRGIWGLRTLVMLGWYTQDSVIAALGYRARAEGWEARR